MAGVLPEDLDGTVVTSSTLALGLDAVCCAGLAVDEALVAATADEDTVLMVGMLGRACGGKFSLTSARSRSRWKPHCRMRSPMSSMSYRGSLCVPNSM